MWELVQHDAAKRKFLREETKNRDKDNCDRPVILASVSSMANGVVSDESLVVSLHKGGKDEIEDILICLSSQ